MSRLIDSVSCYHDWSFKDKITTRRYFGFGMVDRYLIECNKCETLSYLSKEDFDILVEKNLVEVKQ